MKKIIKRLGIAPYLRTPYNNLIKNPYWKMRQLAHLPLSKQVDNTEAYFWPDPRIQHYHEFQSERQNIHRIVNDVKKDDVFYDIGANIGIYSCLISYNVSAVFAFEPSPASYEYLQKNAKLNKGIKCYQKVISDEDTTVKFSIDKSDHFGRMSSLKDSSKNVSYESLSIESARLDTLISKSGFPKPDVLKIDVEGAELNVLNGLGELISTPRIIYCEIHPHRLEEFSSSKEDIYQILKQNGYRIEVLQNRDDAEFVKAISE